MRGIGERGSVSDPCALPGAARTAPAALAAALLAFAAGACEPAPNASDTAIRTDSAGVALVEHPRLPPNEASRIAIAAEPDLVLGGAGALAGPDHEFFRIAGVARLDDGTLVVANSGSFELRYYGEDGRLLRSVGGEGDGPGEFRSLAGPWITAGDTVVVWDMRARRFQLFGPDGAFVRAASMAQAPFAGFLTPQPRTVLGNGRVAAFLSSPPTPTDGVPQRQPLLVALHRIGEERWDSLRVVPGAEQIIEPLGDGLAMTAHTFGAYAVAAGAGATAAVADAARFRVELFDPEGRPVSILSASVPEVPVTADVLEAYIDSSLALWPPGMSDQARESFRTRVRNDPHAPVLPQIRAVFVDGDERLWVERFDVPGPGPSRWEVFARDGTWVGRVEMPEGFARGTAAVSAPGFTIASGRLAGVWTDPDTGVETVRVYRVIEPGS